MSSQGLVDALSLPVYDLGEGHPFAADRQRPLFDLLERQGLLAAGRLLRPLAATRAELETAHRPAYIEAVSALSGPEPTAAALAEAPRFGMGTADNPIAQGQHEAAAAIAGATLHCVREVAEGRLRRAFNPTGGLHHAMPAAASGFCIYNDLVIAIHEALRLGAKRVLYVDFDVHHGDGVEHAFAEDPRVLTVSFHETPEVRWPYTGRITDLGQGAGRGFAVNVPLASGSEDASWLEVVETILPPLARRFAPDLILSQHGCDTHREDPLAELQLTTAAMQQAARLVDSLAQELCEGRWVATGGGGYRPLRVIPRAWTLVWAVMAGRELPQRLDSGWLEAWQDRSSTELPATFLDEPMLDPRGEQAAACNRRMLAELRQLLGLA